MAEIGKIVLNSGWLAARFSEMNLTGVQLTTTHPPSGSFSPWMSALVPGTVLATLVENKELPDPFYGLKNKEIIDIADSGRDYYTFCFFTKFECKLAVNQHVDLNFRAINYFAEVYLNGHKRVLGKGMFRRHSLDVTDILSPVGQNLLAVIVHPPDHPGRIPTTGGQGGDHEIIVGNEPRLAISNSNDIETTTERTTSVSNDHDKEVESIVDDSSSITPIKRNFTAMTEERVEDMQSTTKRIVEIKREKI